MGSTRKPASSLACLSGSPYLPREASLSGSHREHARRKRAGPEWYESGSINQMPTSGPASKTQAGGALIALPARPVRAPADDEHLVARALAGENWAFEALYRRYVTIVARTVSRLLRSSSDTEDVVQETFSIAFRKLGQLEEVGALRVWIVRIGVSRAHRVLSKRRMFSWLTGEEAATTLAVQAAQGGVSGEERAELALLDRALSAIAPDRRTPWILRHFLGYPVEEIASICGYSHTTAKRRIAEVDAHVRRHTQAKGDKP